MCHTPVTLIKSTYLLTNQLGTKKLSFWSGIFFQPYAPAQDQCDRWLTKSVGITMNVVTIKKKRTKLIISLPGFEKGPR